MIRDKVSPFMWGNMHCQCLKCYFKISFLAVFFVTLQIPYISFGGTSCEIFFLKSPEKVVTSSLKPRELFKLKDVDQRREELIAQISQTILKVPEFQFIRQLAREKGVRVWLFGGTAFGFLHFVQGEAEGARDLKPTYDSKAYFELSSIFKDTQDLDIIIDAPSEALHHFQRRVIKKFPYFFESGASRWEFRKLRGRSGTPEDIWFKEALLGDPDFYNQNSDSNSIGMIEISESSEPLIRDLRHWDDQRSIFLEDVLQNRITYLRSKDHYTTARARRGENPEILSVLRLLTKVYQYSLDISKNDYTQMKQIVEQFDFSKIISKVAQKRLRLAAKKLIFQSKNLETTKKGLENLGLRQKLIQMGDPNNPDDFAWWLIQPFTY